jgi:hypothetical protein
MGTIQDLHFFIRDLMDLFKLEFTPAYNCMEFYKFPVPVNYAKIRSYDESHRKKIILQVVASWSDLVQYRDKAQFNSLLNRINTGLDILDHTEKPEQQEIYHRHIELLIKDLEIYADRLKIDNLTKHIELPYILEKIMPL